MVSIDYSGTSLDTGEPPKEKEKELELFHWKDGSWAQRTTSLDTTKNIICAEVFSFSSIAVFEPNLLPDIGSITAPNVPMLVGVELATSTTFTDPNETDTHTALLDWSDNSVMEGTVIESGGSHVCTEPGVYTGMRHNSRKIYGRVNITRPNRGWVFMIRRRRQRLRLSSGPTACLST
jgi:hypothetical protein